MDEWVNRPLIYRRGTTKRTAEPRVNIGTELRMHSERNLLSTRLEAIIMKYEDSFPWDV